MPDKKKTHTIRLDRLLADRGLVESRERGQSLILAGQVLVNGRKIDKAGTAVDTNAEVTILGDALPFVSRGGLKLEHALDAFSVEVLNKVAIDVGASTGGFTDCLLQRGCRRVYAVDVGYGQLAWKLRQDPRVIPLERTNIRHIDRSLIPEPPDLAVIDVSFISLEKVVPAILPLLGASAEMIALIKPQFEVGKGRIGKGGIVRDADARADVVDRMKSFLRDAGFAVQGVVESPITGQDGNVEYLAYATRRAETPERWR